MNSITVLDIVLLVLFLYFLYSGYSKGFIKQTSTILGIIVALLIAINYYQWFEKYLLPYVDVSEQMLQFLSFAVLFILVNIFIHLLGVIFKKILDMLFLDPLDHVAGAVLGLLKGGLIAYFLVLILAQIPYNGLSEIVDRSFLAARLLDFTPIIKQNLQMFFGP